MITNALKTNREIYFENSITTNKLMRNDHEEDWILDTGATQHMCYIKDHFWKYWDMKLNPIYLEDDTTHTPKGKGYLPFSLPGIGKLLLSNVWYVLTFQKNLLSLVLIK
jgi:hypothetical protein